MLSSFIFCSINSRRFGLEIVRSLSISVEFVGSFESRCAIVCLSVFCLVCVFQFGTLVSSECSSSSSLILASKTNDQCPKMLRKNTF